jgi:2-acylglycerol O-acyltransferase 2
MMLSQPPGVMQVVLKSRSGVFRLALETGTPLVPVVTYGESELFPQFDHPLLKSLNAWMYSKFGLYIPIPTLTSLQNWVRLSESPLPPVQSFAGTPIPVTKTPNPTTEQIAALREEYCKNLEALFAETAPEGLTLQVV